MLLLQLGNSTTSSVVTAENSSGPKRGRASSARSRMVGIGAVLSATVLLGACGSSNDAADPDRDQVVKTYASGVQAAYQASLTSAQGMDSAINSFVAAPSESGLTAARQAWLRAREDYGKTEAFRFYDGPIDNGKTGKEGLINAWPLDEQYIDYVQDKPESGIINRVSDYPKIDESTLVELNEKDGETNISTGWHAIEFLLWGQDLSSTGPGNRPLSDYTTAAHADRRRTYLSVASDLLIKDLTEVADAWKPGVADNYRAQFENKDSKKALKDILTGIGELSGGELVGERMNVAYSEHSQEDEQSCFSDNTTNDFIANADGVRMVVDGQYPGGVQGPGVASYISKKNAAVGKALSDSVAESTRLVRTIPAPFDQHIASGVSDTTPGRVAIAASMKSLESQVKEIVAAAKAADIKLDVSMSGDKK